MVSIPKVLSNKTVISGLAQSPMKVASLFKPAPRAVDKMGKVVAPSPVVKFGKMGAFAADSGAHVAFGPSSLGSPFFVAKKMVCFR